MIFSPRSISPLQISLPEFSSHEIFAAIFSCRIEFRRENFFPFKNTFSYNFVGLTSDRSSPQKVSPQDCFAAEIFVIFLIFDLLISLASLLTFQSRLTSQKKRWQNLSRRNFPRLKKKSCSETFRDETSRGKAVS